MTDFARARERMVERQIAGRGVRDPRVLAAIGSIPRETFVEPGFEAAAYDDGALPIAEGQTISQPYVVALMAEAAELSDSSRVLEVGAGSGYAAAVLSRIADRVVAVERHPGLAEAARARLVRLGIVNVEIVCGDGTLGWPDAAPFDAIVVSAGGPAVPDALKRQLARGGHLVIPVGEAGWQMLIKVTRRGEDAYHTQDLGPVSFVKLIGEEGWSE